jgi:hypothetical protein
MPISHSNKSVHRNHYYYDYYYHYSYGSHHTSLAKFRCTNGKLLQIHLGQATDVQCVGIELLNSKLDQLGDRCKCQTASSIAGILAEHTDTNILDVQRMILDAVAQEIDQFRCRRDNETDELSGMRATQ